jgi:flavin-dependent dehydrogenase
VTTASEHLEAEVLIVGAGPAGTAAAAHLGQLGVNDVLLVDKHDFPRDKTCGSGISPRGIGVLRELGVWADVAPHAYKITGIRLVTRSGHDSWQSAGDAVEAVVCQRRVLDHLILKRALANGVRFVPHVSAERVIESNGRVVGVAAKDGRELRGRVTIIAGGTHCQLVPDIRARGLPFGLTRSVRRPRKLIQAIMGWWDDVPFREGHLEMIFDKDLAPYYGWLFPESPTRVNIGITYEDGAPHRWGRARPQTPTSPDSLKRNARDVFQRFLDKYYGERLAKARQVGAWKGHPIAYSYRIEGLSSPGRLVAGESGLLTHPATAEGIYQGMKSGMLAAEALRDMIVGGKPEIEAFAAYEASVRKAFTASFLGGGVFRTLVQTPALDWLVKIGEQPIVQSAAARVLAAM